MTKYSVSFCALAVLLGGCAASQAPAASAPAASAPAASAPRAEEDVAMSTPVDRAAPPNAVDVSWQDNGVPIRPLSAPGRERELPQPVVASQHRGALSVAPPANSDALSAKKKPSASK